MKQGSHWEVAPPCALTRIHDKEVGVLAVVLVPDAREKEAGDGVLKNHQAFSRMEKRRKEGGKEGTRKVSAGAFESRQSR